MSKARLASVTMEMYRSWIINHPDLFEQAVRDFVREHRPNAAIYAMPLGPYRVQLVAEYV